MHHTSRHPLDETVHHTDHGAELTLTERLLIGVIIGMLAVGAALAVGRLDAATTSTGTTDGFHHLAAIDHDPTATGAATPEGNTRP